MAFVKVADNSLAVGNLNKKYFRIVTNLMDTHCFAFCIVFSNTYLLNLVKPELAPFHPDDPPTPKTPL